MKTTPNLDFLLDFAKQYSDSNLDRVNFTLDFPYEVEKRYKQACKENREFANLIYDMLIEDGIYKGDKLSDNDFRLFIRGQMTELLNIADEGFL